MPPVASVSHWQYVAVGVPAHSLAGWLQGSALERCWTYTYPGVLFLLVSNRFEIVRPWFLALQWYDELLLRNHYIRFVPLR